MIFRNFFITTGVYINKAMLFSQDKTFLVFIATADWSISTLQQSKAKTQVNLRGKFGWKCAEP